MDVQNPCHHGLMRKGSDKAPLHELSICIRPIPIFKIDSFCFGIGIGTQVSPLQRSAASSFRAIFRPTRSLVASLASVIPSTSSTTLSPLSFTAVVLLHPLSNPAFVERVSYYPGTSPSTQKPALSEPLTYRERLLSASPHSPWE